MPRYYFGTQIGEVHITDPSGQQLRDADHAWQTARDTIMTTLREAKDQPRLFSAVLVVTDEDGEIVFEFPFAEAMALETTQDAVLH